MPEPITWPGGQPGVAPGGLGEDVDGVGGDQQDSVEAGRHHVTDKFFEQCHVLADEVDSGLAGLLCGSGADHDHGGVGAVGVGALGDEGGGGCPDDAVVEVHDLADELVVVDIDDRQVIGQTLVDQGVRVRDTHVSGADEHDAVPDGGLHGHRE